MNVYYITGTSSGLGKALAEELLKSEDNQVVGISRKCEISHPNYVHKQIDLTDEVSTAKFRFGDHFKADSVYLINNAGTLGEIGYHGELDGNELADAYKLNMVAPAILINGFLAAYKEKESEKVILNISSGASVAPYPGWGMYCATKAGVNMLTEVVKEEAKLNGVQSFSIQAIAPGIVESPMQEQIRSTPKEKFDMVDRFIALKNDGELQSPEETAMMLVDHINGGNFENAFVDLRNLIAAKG